METMSLPKNFTIYSALYSSNAHLNFAPFKVATLPNDLTNPGILILHGGEDISPMIYNQVANNYTNATNFPSKRDKIEIELVKKAMKSGILIFGICRGAQLLCALTHGSLIQHVTNHISGDHEIITNNERKFNVSSCHHQMMNVTNTEHELLAWSSPSRSTMYLGQFNKELNIEKEPEVVWFPRVNGLAIQGHPEWMKKNDPFNQYLLSLIRTKLNVVL